MHFSMSCGLSFMCVSMLLFLPAHGLQYARPKVVKVPPIPPSCCPEVSDAPIGEPVSSCFEQQIKTFAHCKIHAYIFFTKSGYYCVDPHASWLPERLKRLKKRGIVCKVM